MREFCAALASSGIVPALLRPSTLKALPWLYRYGLGYHALYALYAAASPSRIALCCHRGRLTYGLLWSRIRRVADALCASGLAPGGGVALFCRNRAEFIEVQAASSLAGLRLILASTRSSAEELAYLLQDSRSQVLIFESALKEVAQAAGAGLKRAVAVGAKLPGVESYEDLVARGSPHCPHLAPRAGRSRLVQYTAGTTGKPKGAVREEGPRSLAALLGFLSRVPLGHEDIHLVTCPLYHSHGLGLATVHIALGATVCLLEKFTPAAFMEAVSGWKITSTAVVPTMIVDLLGACDKKALRGALRSLRCVVASGAPLSPALRRSFAEALGRDIVYDAYGATELGWVTVAGPKDARERPATIGKAVPGIEIALLDERGERCGPGRVGEIFARSALLFAGYDGLPRRSPAAGWEGYFSAGDMGWMDEQGYYYLSGRKRELIISGGVNVYPAEVEAVLLSHPDVREAAVCGIPDARWGEMVCAAVVVKGRSTTAETIRGFCRARMGTPKVPKKIVILDALPRTETGKVTKAKLKEIFLPDAKAEFALDRELLRHAR